MGTARKVLLVSALFIITGLAASLELGLALTAVADNLSRSKRQALTDDSDLPEIADFYIVSNVTSRFATVVVTSRVLSTVTTGNASQEADFSVQIPENAFISNFSMVIEGKLYIGEVMEKAAAQKKYDEAKKKGQSAGQVKHQTRDLARGMDLFKINVNVAAGSEVSFTLTYQQILDRRLGVYEQRIMVQPLQIVENLVLELSYDESQTFTDFSYRLPKSSTVLRGSSEEVTFKAKPDQRVIRYAPSVNTQRRMNAEVGISGEFVVSYDVKHSPDGSSIISSNENDYFIHYFAMDRGSEVPVLQKNILFVIDISGSMSGRKMEQTRQAMNLILTKLGNSDYFNIMVFDDDTSVWLNTPEQASGYNIERAKSFVDDNVRANGGTNIHGALTDGVRWVTAFKKPYQMSNIIVFLTDGQPTAGITDDRQIREDIKRLNENRVVIFSLGFGIGVDFNFLQQVSWESGGFAWKIYEADDAVSQLTTFFEDINYPLLLKLEFKYDPNQVDLLTVSGFDTFFSGTEVMVAGKKSVDTLNVTVEGGKTADTVRWVVKSEDQTALSGVAGEFIEKMWAYMTIKEYIKMATIADTEEIAKVYNQRALKMSLDYNFVTPLTSLVVVQHQESDSMTEQDVIRSKNYNMASGPIPSSSPRLFITALLVFSTPYLLFLIG